MKKNTLLFLVFAAFGISVFWLWHTGRLHTVSALQVPHILLEDFSNTNFLPPPLRAGLGNPGSALTASGVLMYTNTERTSEHLAQLKLNSQLTQAANLKLADMFAGQYFEHISPQGIGPSDLAEKVGYKYVVVGENLALGNFHGNQELVAAWMESPGHRANILNKRFTEIGIAVGKGIFEGKNVWLAVQSFGTPLSACPQISEKLRKDITLEKITIEKEAAELRAEHGQLEELRSNNPSTYNARVSIYNNKVQGLNMLIDQAKTDIAEYNRQVETLNQCITHE